MNNYTGWNDTIVVQKKKHDSFILKLLLKKSIQLTWLWGRADIYSITASIRIRNCLSYKRRRELGEYSVDGGNQADFGVVGGHVGDVLEVWPN